MAKQKTAKAKTSPDKRRKTLPVAPKKPQGSGKFVKGKATVGRTKTGKHPEFKRKLEFAELFKAALTNQDIKDVAKSMLKEAKGGNVKAAQLVLDRCCGKVKEEVSLSLSSDTQDFLDYMGENYGGLPG